MKPALPAQPRATPWPTAAWPRGRARAQRALERLADVHFSDTARFGECHALVVVEAGVLVLERYAGEPHTAASTYPSWSMAKSLTHALAGFAVSSGALKLDAPVPVPEWQDRNDPRRAITLHHLITMSSGLRWHEAYDPAAPSDVIEMLFGRGQDDVAAFAAGFPLVEAPGATWLYSSGTTNIIARGIMLALGLDRTGFERFMRERLFAPLGITSAAPKFDARGTFIGSSFCFMTAEDFARFGLLYLRGGRWDDRVLLPAAWIDAARTPVSAAMPADEPRGYGAHWWLKKDVPGVFYAAGFEGQYIVLDPVSDLIIVRHGRSEPVKDNVRRWLSEVVTAVRMDARP